MALRARPVPRDQRRLSKLFVAHRPLLPPTMAAAHPTPPTPVARAPADFVLKAFDERAGPMGPAEFALLQAAMRQRQEGSKEHR